MLYKIDWDDEKKEFKYISFEHGEKIPRTNLVGDADGVPYYSLITSESLAKSVTDTLNENYRDKHLVVGKCRNCGQYFLTFGAEAAWYKDREYQLPKRCYCCRKGRTINRARRLSAVIKGGLESERATE